MPIRRRTALLAGLVPLPLWARPDALAELEHRSGGKLGVAMLDSASGATWTHRGNERFGLCSTFKLPLAAAVLAQADAGRWRLSDSLPLRSDDLAGVGHAPITRARLRDGRMKLAELAEAAQVHSDNGAANLLLQHLDGAEGPQALTRWLRDQGDAVTRLDRFEPEMNRVLPGEERDTSSPAAFAATALRLFTGTVLKPDSRAHLRAWMEATQTGKARLRAGLPARWRAGDKTGTGFAANLPDRVNDVCIIWPPKHAPVAVACFYESPQRSTDWVRPQDEAVLAQVGRLAAAWALKAG